MPLTLSVSGIQKYPLFPAIDGFLSKFSTFRIYLLSNVPKLKKSNIWTNPDIINANYHFSIICDSSVQFTGSVCLTLCNPMNCSTPGLPVHHQLLEFTQTHVRPFKILFALFHLIYQKKPTKESYVSSSGSSLPRNQTWVSFIEGRFFTSEPPGDT